MQTFNKIFQDAMDSTDKDTIKFFGMEKECYAILKGLSVGDYVPTLSRLWKDLGYFDKRDQMALSGCFVHVQYCLGLETDKNLKITSIDPKYKKITIA